MDNISPFTVDLSIKRSDFAMAMLNQRDPQVVKLVNLHLRLDAGDTTQNVGHHYVPESGAVSMAPCEPKNTSTS